jgi:hypothetical protein
MTSSRITRLRRDFCSFVSFFVLFVASVDVRDQLLGTVAMGSSTTPDAARAFWSERRASS